MNAVLRRRLERAARVRDFIRAHKTDGTGEGTALARLEELLQRAEALAAQQRAGLVATRSATLRRRAKRRSAPVNDPGCVAGGGAVGGAGELQTVIHALASYQPFLARLSPPAPARGVAQVG